MDIDTLEILTLSPWWLVLDALIIDDCIFFLVTKG